MVSPVALLALLVSAPLERRDMLCGAHCCYVALKTLGFPAGTFADFEKRLGKPGNLGYSLQQLKDAAISYGAHAECIRCDFDGLNRIERPYVALPLLRGGHFIALMAFDERLVWFVDPPDYVEAPRPFVEGRWPGEALVIAIKPLPLPVPTAKTVPWRLWAILAVLIAIASALAWLLCRRRGKAFGMVLGISLMGGCGNAPVDRPGPVVAADAYAKFLGRYVGAQSKPLLANFFIRNAGSGTLELGTIRLSCNCAEAELSATTLRANEVGELRVKLRPHELAGSPSAQIRVPTNDPANSLLVFQVNWEVVSEFSFEPSELEFDSAAPAQSKVIRLVYHGEIPLEDIEKSQIEFDCRALRVEPKWQNSSSSAAIGEFLITPLSPFFIGAQSKEVRVRLPKRSQEFVFPIRVVERKSIAVSPTEIYVGLVAPLEKTKCKFLVQSNVEPIASVRLATEAKAGVAMLQLEPNQVANSRLVEIEVEAPANSGVFSKMLRLEINGAKETIAVGVRGFVQ